jgi:hypothetical protein
VVVEEFLVDLAHSSQSVDIDVQKGINSVEDLLTHVFLHVENNYSTFLES